MHIKYDEVFDGQPQGTVADPECEIISGDVYPIEYGTISFLSDSPVLKVDSVRVIEVDRRPLPTMSLNNKEVVQGMEYPLKKGDIITTRYWTVENKLKETIYTVTSI